jgi:hypothetical protein
MEDHSFCKFPMGLTQQNYYEILILPIFEVGFNVFHKWN